MDDSAASVSGGQRCRRGESAQMQSAAEVGVAEDVRPEDDAALGGQRRLPQTLPSSAGRR